MSDSILEALYTKLGADTSGGSLHDKLGGRYYHIFAPQDEPFPNMVYSLVNQDPIRHMGSSVTQEMFLDFDIYADHTVGVSAALGLGTIEESLYDLLDQFELSVTGFDRGVILFETRNVRVLTDDEIRVTDRVMITATEGL